MRSECVNILKLLGWCWEHSQNFGMEWLLVWHFARQSSSFSILYSIWVYTGLTLNLFSSIVWLLPGSKLSQMYVALLRLHCLGPHQMHGVTSTCKVKCQSVKIVSCAIPANSCLCSAQEVAKFTHLFFCVINVWPSFCTYEVKFNKSCLAGPIDLSVWIPYLNIW